VLSVPPGVQGLINQELSTQMKAHKERSKEKKRMGKKFNKRKSFSQVEMTFSMILGKYHESIHFVLSTKVYMLYHCDV